MLIADGQIHLWEKGTPSAHHRQEPFSAEQALAWMDEALFEPAHVTYALPVHDVGHHEAAADAHRDRDNHRSCPREISHRCAHVRARVKRA